MYMLVRVRGRACVHKHPNILDVDGQVGFLGDGDGRRGCRAPLGSVAIAVRPLDMQCRPVCVCACVNVCM